MGSGFPLTSAGGDEGREGGREGGEEGREGGDEGREGGDEGSAPPAPPQGNVIRADHCSHLHRQAGLLTLHVSLL